jgi:TM2 domain-containing membrane protein YozV
LAAALCWFFGIIGVHRFYLGYTFIGILQIFTLGGLGIWTLIDFILILTGDLKPKKGSYKGTVTEEMDELFN